MTTKTEVQKEYRLHRRNFTIRTSVALTATRFDLTRLQVAEILGLGQRVIDNLDKPLVLTSYDGTTSADIRSERVVADPSPDADEEIRILRTEVIS